MKIKFKYNWFRLEPLKNLLKNILDTFEGINF